VRTLVSKFAFKWVNLYRYLEMLFLDQNALSSPPRLPPSLVSLDVSHNRLRTLFPEVEEDEEDDDRVAKMPTLRDMYAVGNRIASLPRTLSADAPNLRRLYLG
jgi:Leucine-rich repeat (LRR) protein